MPKKKHSSRKKSVSKTSSRTSSKKAASPKGKAKKAVTKKKAAARKKAPAKKTAAKKAAAKKPATKKPATKKAAGKKAAAKKAATKKTAAKKAPARKKAASKSASKSAKRVTRDGRGVRNKNSRKNIKRIDSEKTHGWQVHVCRGGKLKTKLFSDRLCGGKKAALTEALTERDNLLGAMEKFAKPLWKVKRTARTNTGELGVSYTEVKGTGGRKRGYVSATVRVETGKAANRKFSVDSLGYEQAVKQAVAWRNKMLRERGAREKKNKA